MYRVVVVDDEPLLLRGIKKSIESAHPQFCVVETISDSEIAVDTIERLSPDIVFTDIRMPVVDGLKLIEELERRRIKTKVIILSGYQDFSYAKKALKHGVQAYLLKPIDIEELSQLLKSIYLELSTFQKQTEYQLLNDLIRNPVIGSLPQEITQTFKTYKHYNLILLCSGSNCTFRCNWITPAKDFWLKNDLGSLIEKHFLNSATYWIFDLDNGNEKLIVLADFNNSETELRNLCNKLHSLLSEQRFPVTIVSGQSTSNLDDLPYVVQYYKILLAQNVVFSYSKIIFSEYKRPSKEELAGSLIYQERRNTLKLCLEKQHTKQFKLEFKLLLDDCKRKQLSQLGLTTMLKQVISMFQETLVINGNNRLLETSMEIDELISNSFTYDNVFEGMCILFDDLFSSLKQQTDKKKNSTIIAKKVEEYILQYYTKPISVQSISSNLGFTPPYLSDMFKKYKGIPPMEFIIELRIKKAKELLLLTPPLPLKEISESIGYEDSYYMSRIFKSVTGKSPTQFRIDSLS